MFIVIVDNDGDILAELVVVVIGIGAADDDDDDIVAGRFHRIFKSANLL